MATRVAEEEEKDAAAGGAAEEDRDTQQPERQTRKTRTRLLAWQTKRTMKCGGGHGIGQ